MIKLILLNLLKIKTMKYDYKDGIKVIVIFILFILLKVFTGGWTKVFTDLFVNNR